MAVPSKFQQVIDRLDNTVEKFGGQLASHSAEQAELTASVKALTETLSGTTDGKVGVLERIRVLESDKVGRDARDSGRKKWIMTLLGSMVLLWLKELAEYFKS